MNKVMRIIKEKNLDIVNQKMELNCEIEIATRKKMPIQYLTFFQLYLKLKLKN